MIDPVYPPHMPFLWLRHTRVTAPLLHVLSMQMAKTVLLLCVLCASTATNGTHVRQRRCFAFPLPSWRRQRLCHMLVPLAAKDFRRLSLRLLAGLARPGQHGVPPPAFVFSLPFSLPFSLRFHCRSLVFSLPWACVLTAFLRGDLALPPRGTVVRTPQRSQSPRY